MNEDKEDKRIAYLVRLAHGLGVIHKVNDTMNKEGYFPSCVQNVDCGKVYTHEQVLDRWEELTKEYANGN